MIKVHHARWESPAAIGTWHIAQLVEKAGVFLPLSALPLEVSRSTALEGCNAVDIGGTGAQSVAVGADDVALAYLREQPRSGHQHCAALGQAEQLGCRISMVEVHLMGLEQRTAVGTWAAAETPKEVHCRCLAGLHPLDLTLAIPPVVRDVRRTLARTLPHAQV